jgi:hypothetical protein
MVNPTRNDALKSRHAEMDDVKFWVVIWASPSSQEVEMLVLTSFDFACAHDDDIYT